MKLSDQICCTLELFLPGALLVEHMSVKENGAYMENNYSIRTIILVALCLQNACYTLVRKYSTKYEDVSSKEILLVSELIKIVFSVYMIINEKDSTKSDSQGEGIGKLVWLLKNSSKMFILALIYGAMNILSFVALQYIGAGEFTICAQLKILTTAGFAVFVLKTSLTPTKWRALALLVLGCILVASPSFTQSSSTSSGTEASTGASTMEVLQVFGYAAVLTEVVLSGFASIYFEKVVKSTTELVTIWERNFQLGVYSLVMYGGIIIYENYFAAMSQQGHAGSEGGGAEVVQRAMWSNWTFVTLMVSVLGALGTYITLKLRVFLFVFANIWISACMLPQYDVISIFIYVFCFNLYTSSNLNLFSLHKSINRRIAGGRHAEVRRCHS